MKCPIVIALSAALLAGCAFERHYSIVPGQDQVVEVESGDRWQFSLDEAATDGCEWDYVCDDNDVEVTIEHVADLAKVQVRIHRGYDGPSTVKFFQRQHGKGKTTAKPFVISLFKRTGDEAFWK